MSIKALFSGSTARKFSPLMDGQLKPTELIHSVDQFSGMVSQWTEKGERIAIVPTMGALHAGHLSLVDAAVKTADRVVVSIYVNPAQFGAGEDLGKYPRDLDGDVRLIAERGVDVVFAPSDSEVYPPGFGSWVEPGSTAKLLEGQSRPTHFRGVTTVVLKLLNLSRADIAWFGQKDYQQCAVVKQMVRELNVPCEIRVAPTVRDEDGLALSSRNRYLNQEERSRALSLVRTLQEAAGMIRGGERDGHVVMACMNQSLIDGGVSEVDYAMVVDPVSLETMREIRLPTALLVAAKVGTTRLIDNWIVE